MKQKIQEIIEENGAKNTGKLLGLSKISNVENLYGTWQIIIFWAKSNTQKQKF